jgi:hypothetical protein
MNIELTVFESKDGEIHINPKQVVSVYEKSGRACIELETSRVVEIMGMAAKQVVERLSLPF